MDGNKNPAKGREVASRIVEELAACDVGLVASLPDNWLTDVINAIDGDERIYHIPVNREESAIGLCAGAFMGGKGSVALMGTSGFMTCIYAITKINYSYEIPLLLLTTLRGGFGDHHKHHISNGLYFEPVMQSLAMPYTIIDKAEDISEIRRAYQHSRTFTRPTVVALTRDLLR